MQIEDFLFGVKNMPTIKGFNIDGNTYTYQDENIAPEWVSGQWYDYGDIVYHNGELYRRYGSGYSGENFDGSWESITLSDALNNYEDYLREEFDDYLDGIQYEGRLLLQAFSRSITPPLIGIDLSEVGEGNIYEFYADRSINMIHFEKDEEGRICQIQNDMDGSTVNIIWEKEEEQGFGK